MDTPNSLKCLIFYFLILLFSVSGDSRAEDAYSLFGKLFLSGRVEYDFTNRRNFLADTEEERVRKDNFDFDRLFRRGFHSVLIIEETAGDVKNILSLGEVPTTFTQFTFDQIDLNGIRWEVRSNRTDWTILMVPGTLNPLNSQERMIDGSGIGLREVTKLGKTQLGLSWYFRQAPVWSVDMETNFANNGVKAEIAITPKNALRKDLKSRYDAATTVFKAFRTVGDTLFQAEAYRVGPQFDASRSVGDNDDQDRYSDNSFLDPPSLIIPGDLDKNNNGIFDYEDDILLFDVDEDFLDEVDRNNNGIRDEEENDHEPNYEFDVGLQGIRLFMNSKMRQTKSVIDLELGVQLEKNLKFRNFPTSQKAFANIVYKKALPRASSFIFENEIKWVKDSIPDETWYFSGFLSHQEMGLYQARSDIQEMIYAKNLQFFYVDGGAEIEKRRLDPLLMQNDIINTAKLTWEYHGINRMVTTARAKLQYDIDFDNDNEHYEVGIFKTLYRLRPSKSLEISPMLKYTIRNGFRMAEDQLEYLTLRGRIDDTDIIRHIRLRQIEQAHVRDMTPTFILKIVYQFTKTIKLTGGGQILLYNDLLKDDSDFVRQALLAEMEKSFFAYRKQLFLHIGTRYIDQRAVGDINDQNYMEMFVRVFGKF
ncbi:hypothetical protein F4X73_16335 [Candidatus Poribacteria bacterium]|nr:hypothetical protein [Candidatus Poribacteria bacterium]MYF56039.1 hypothetical protein [Candidatus Poribacteria bacterium]